jgi:hypothetical protein
MLVIYLTEIPYLHGEEDLKIFSGKLGAYLCNIYQSILALGLVQS